MRKDETLPLPVQIPPHIHLINLPRIQKCPGILHIDAIPHKKLKTIPVDMIVLDHFVKNIERLTDGLGLFVGPV